MRSVQVPPISQPVPFWASVSNAKVLGSGRIHGHEATEVSFFDPLTPGWFDAWVEKSSGHTLVLTMIAVAHFMHHVYGPFNAPFELRPPST